MKEYKTSILSKKHKYRGFLYWSKTLFVNEDKTKALDIYKISFKNE